MLTEFDPLYTTVILRLLGEYSPKTLFGFAGTNRMFSSSYFKKRCLATSTALDIKLCL
jgi:hypothetical protein